MTSSVLHRQRPFALPLVALWRNCRDRWLWLAAATCGLVFLALTQAIWLPAHYAAPVTGAGARASRRRDAKTARLAMARALRGPLAVGGRRRDLRAGVRRALGQNMVPGRLPRRPAAGRAAAGERRRASPGIRARLARPRLPARSGSTTGPTSTARPWFGPARSRLTEDRQLREYYADRKAWVVIADEQPPRLLPYDDALVAAYPRRPNPYLQQASNATAVVR